MLEELDEWILLADVVDTLLLDVDDSASSTLAELEDGWSLLPALDQLEDEQLRGTLFPDNVGSLVLVDIPE